MTANDWNVGNERKKKRKKQKDASLNAMIFEGNLNYPTMPYLYYKNLRFTIDVPCSKFEYSILEDLLVSDQRTNGQIDTAFLRFTRPHIPYCP